MAGGDVDIIQRYMYELCKDIDIVNDVKLRRLQWAGHVMRIRRKVMM
jgi:hypothetical protein